MDEQCDILVLGAGLAGCSAALSAADEGKKVIIVTKTPQLMSGNTPYAQGGIIYKGLHDSPEKLKTDILIAGDGHCWEPAVDQLVHLGPDLVEKILLERCAVDFDYNGDELDRTAEGAHSESRIIHSKDKTGKSIEFSITQKVQTHPNIKILTDHTVVDLLTLSHHSKNSVDIYEKPACFGAYLLNNKTECVFPNYASRTILATGGLGRIYLHSTNPKESTGDGIALAWRAGARCFNLQYIQFHPTTLYSSKERFLISESVRGEGGVLVDKNGRQFMFDFHPQGSLAPRDIVARAIHQTMLDTEHPCVYLDIRSKDPQWLQARFPTINQHCLDVGVDMTKDLIPVVPAAHYSCGGVGVSLKGQTSVQRLYAVGEVSCTGVHGANRLASTSLLEALVWGHLAGKDAAKTCKQKDYYPEIDAWEECSQRVDQALISQDWNNIKSTMWNYVGLIRTPLRMHRAQTIFHHLQSEVESFYRDAKMTKEIVELRHGIQTAIAVSNAAIQAKKNLGAHYIKEEE